VPETCNLWALQAKIQSNNLLINDLTINALRYYIPIASPRTADTYVCMYACAYGFVASIALIVHLRASRIKEQPQSFPMKCVCRHIYLRVRPQKALVY